MRKLSGLFRIVLITALTSCLSTSCTKEARKSRQLNNAERDFKAGAYDKAKIEYLNVLRLDGANAIACSRLGQIWFDEGAPIKAGAFLIRARDLAPNDLENRLRLARAYNAVGRQADGRKEALFVLQHSPASGEALLLLADMTRTPEEFTAAEQIMNGFPEKKSVAYYLAGAKLAMHKLDPAAAQPLIERALAINPKSAEAHLAHAILSLLQKNPKTAGTEFKAAAELSPPRSSMKITYADYLAHTGAAAEASAYLKELTKSTPDFLPPWTLLARNALSEKKYDEALALLENVFSRDPDSVDGRLVQADALLAKQQTKKAVDVLEALERNLPGAPAIKFQLARAYLQADKPEQASAALNEAITANPNFAEAILLLAEINLRTGKAAPAISPLEGLLKKKGDLRRAQILLADAYRSTGRLDDAAAIFRQQITQSPQNAEAYVLLGVIQEEQKKPEDARRSFEKALELDPAKLLALSKLVDLDLAAKDFDRAMGRVQQQMQKAPNSGSSYLLKGRVLAAKREWPEAEAALKKAIELDPNLAPAYDLLVGIYLEAGKSDQAVRELEAVLVKSPQNRGALITLASIEEKKGDYPKARDVYEKLLAFDGNDVAALNNLAYIYAERLNQLDKALELARKARTLAPDNPAVADTLGWVLFKRDEYQQAVPVLEEAAGKISDGPEVRFHLAMAHYMMGQADAARSDFKQALSTAQDFPGKKEAEVRLDLLNQTSAGSSALTAEQLETMLKEHPKDMGALLRVAEVYKSQNSFDRAASAYEEALKLNPKLASAALELAKLHAGPLKNPQKALEFAKKARDLSPADPQAAGILGRIAFDAANFPWAYSLLQEGSRQSESDPKVLHDFAWAAYSLGKIDQARQAMQQSLDASPDAEIAVDAKSFLLLTGAELDPSALPGAKPEIEQKLQKDPNYVPALMAAAALDSQAGRTKEAVTRYQDALRTFPDFAPAQKQLAFLYSKEPARIAEAYDLALQARKSLPADPAVAQLLGQLSYEKKEYSRAVQLLQESARKKPLDAEGLYYLGLSFKEAKQPAEARKALAAALAAGLSSPSADVAHRALAELKKQ
jgi:tetratricopeptide (TPR) repeat protein